MAVINPGAAPDQSPRPEGPVEGRSAAPPADSPPAAADPPRPAAVVPAPSSARPAWIVPAESTPTIRPTESSPPVRSSEVTLTDRSTESAPSVRSARIIPADRPAESSPPNPQAEPVPPVRPARVVPADLPSESNPTRQPVGLTSTDQSADIAPANPPTEPVPPARVVPAGPPPESNPANPPTESSLTHQPVDITPAIPPLGGGPAVPVRRHPFRLLLCSVLILAAAVGGFMAADLVARRAWATTIASGQAVAVLKVPRFGPDWAVPVLEGVDGVALRRGVGWYPGTTPPGQIGNCVLVGQRLGSGRPFFRLLELQAGDLVLVETAYQVLTYVIDVAPVNLTVDRRQSGILDPVPMGADLIPSQSLLTLVTAQDLLPTGDRSVGIAVLTEARPK